MYSIRKGTSGALWTLALAAGLTLAGGCQRNAVNYAAEPVTDTPLVEDAAMNKRIWNQSDAVYQNGSVVADASPGFAWRPSYSVPDAADPLAEVGIFLVNVVTLPVTLATAPRRPVYGGVELQPSHTAQPPLPEGNVYAEDWPPAYERAGHKSARGVNASGQ